MRSLPVLVPFAALIAGIFYLHPPASLDSRSTVSPSTDAAVTNRLLHRQPGLFVPNVGQWDHRAKFVYRNGPMTLFVQDRGWIMDLTQRPAKPDAGRHEFGCPTAQQPTPGDAKVDQKIRGVVVQMTFEGDDRVPEIVGEKKSAGHHNYFLGNEESRWRTEVPLYGSVRYAGLYPGIDLRLREMDGVPEYDLLLQPGAELSLVSVHVEGGQNLSIAKDGSLVIETSLGLLTQSVPKTWQVGSDGGKQEVACDFTLLGEDRFYYRRARECEVALCALGDPVAHGIEIERTEPLRSFELLRGHLAGLAIHVAEAVVRARVLGRANDAALFVDPHRLRDVDEVVEGAELVIGVDETRVRRTRGFHVRSRRVDVIGCDCDDLEALAA